MEIILFGTNSDTLNEWAKKLENKSVHLVYDLQELQKHLQSDPKKIVLVDYDSAASEYNKLISANELHPYSIVLEKAPAVQTGKMLVTQGIKGYGNSKMHQKHLLILIQTVADGNIWTYPELTAALASKKTKELSQESLDLLQDRLTQKEIEVVELILKGLTNDAIAQKLEISTRTVKAHVGSIFSKLHVNDRLSLVLLLK